MVSRGVNWVIGTDIYALLYLKSEKALGTHSSTLACKIPWTEEPGRLQSMGSWRVGHDWATSLSLFIFHALEKEMTTHSSVLAWRISGTGEHGGLPSMGSRRVVHDWSDLAAAAGVIIECNNSQSVSEVTVLIFGQAKQKSLSHRH